MTANSLFIASIFDGPWVFLILVLISAVANWLQKRRAGTEDQQPGGSSDGQRDANWEERLRRMLGEEAPTASPKAPPVISQPPRRPIRPVIVPTIVGEVKPIVRTLPPPTRSPQRPTPGQKPAIVRQPVISDGAGGGVEETVHRYEKLDPAVKTPVRSSARRRPAVTVNWRQPQAAREAFVASLVFGSPKGLEG